MPPRNSASERRESIHAFLAKYADGKYSDSGVDRDFETGQFVIVLPRSAIAATDRALRMLESRISKDLGIGATVKRLARGGQEAISDVLLQALVKVLGDGLEDVIIAGGGSACDVVVLLESADCIPDKKQDKLAKHRIEDIFRSLELSTGSVSYALLRDDVPSEHQIIRHLSIASPVSVDGLVNCLSEAGLTVPSARWLNAKLDYLRRSGFLVFQKSVGFALTESGLALLPRQDHRNSPDIQRALALARRNWVR